MKTLAWMIAVQLLPLAIAAADSSSTQPGASPVIPEFDMPTEFLGHYVVSNIERNEGGYKVGICKPYKNKRGSDRDADSRCGKELWMVRDEKNLAFLKPAVFIDGYPKVARYESFQFIGDCDSTLSVASATRGIFAPESRFCRALPKRGASKRGFDTFLFNGSLDPKAPGATARATRGAYNIGMPIGVWVASDLTIELPQVELYPKKVIVREEVVGVNQIAFFPLPIRWVDTLTLTYVGP